MTDHRKVRKLKKQGVEEVKHGKINYRDQPIHFTRTGKPNGTPLVFVHGSPGSSSQFLPYHSDSSLIQNFNIYSVDRPGFGFSGFGDAESDLDEQARALNAWVDSMKLQNAILVGHSYGGPAIVRMAMLDQDRIGGLVIVGGSVSAELEPDEPWRKWLDKPILNWWMPRSFRVSNSEILALKQHLKAMESDWKRIEIPVAIVHGAKDNLVPPENVEYMENQLSQSVWVKKYIYPEENHFIPFTRPEILKNAIFDLRKFLGVATIDEDQKRIGR
jgi:pimeloyl-ACP methyl ester carboxylesterase